MLKTNLDQTPDRVYLRIIETEYGGKVENPEEDPLIKKTGIKVVNLKQFESKIKDINFIRKVVSTLQDLYEWKLEQYQKRIQELIKIFEKDDRVIKKAALSDEERKEAGMSSSSNLKLMYASLADTFDLVNSKYIELASAGDEILNEFQQKFMNIVYDSEKGLRTLVGNQYENIKTSICTLLSSLEGGMGAFTKTFQNIVIVGPAGVGKTTLAKYLAFYYNESGILATDIVNVITRPDLVGQYLGETGMKTKRRMIDSLEGIIFIDEAYQLGGCPDPDTYGMESITEIVNFLDKYMALSITIVAGYENEMNLCFFSRNEGLRRRFPNQYKLKDYKFYDLFMIFIKGCYQQIYEYYSLASKSNSPENAFQVSKLFLDSVYKTFDYLNQKVCPRLTNELDKETGQYVKDKDTGLYKKEFKDTSCYFQNQGGDVGILIAKFFNNFYNKNNPSHSFIGAVMELGIVKQVPSGIIQQDIDEMVNKLFDEQSLTEEFVELPKQMGKRTIKEFSIPDLVKIMGTPGDKELNKIFSAVDGDKLKRTVEDLNKDIDSKSNYPKSWLVNKAKLFGEVFTQTQAAAAAEFVLEKYNDWIQKKDKEKLKKPPQPTIEIPKNSPPKEQKFIQPLPPKEKETKKKKKEESSEKTSKKEKKEKSEKEGTPKTVKTPKKTKKSIMKEESSAFKFQPPAEITKPGELQDIEKKSPPFTFQAPDLVPFLSPTKNKPKQSPEEKTTAKKQKLSPKEKVVVEPKIATPALAQLWVQGQNTPAELIKRIDPNKIKISLEGKQKGAYSRDELQNISQYLALPTPKASRNQVLAEGIYEELKKNNLA